MSKCSHENKVQMEFGFKPSGSDPRYNQHFSARQHLSPETTNTLKKCDANSLYNQKEKKMEMQSEFIQLPGGQQRNDV